MKTLSIKQMQHLQSLGLDCSKTSVILIFTDESNNILTWDEIYFDKNNNPIYINSWDSDIDRYDCPAYAIYHDEDTGNYDHSYRDSCGVFTLDDILDILPCLYPMHEIKDGQEIKRRNFKGSAYCPNLYKEDDVYYIKLINNNLEILVSFSSDLAIDAAYQLLIWCIENGHIKTNKNERN